MAKTKNDDKLLDNEAISTESEVTDDVSVSNDDEAVNTDVDITSTSEDTIIDDSSVTENDNAAVSDTDDSTNTTTEDDDLAEAKSNECEIADNGVCEPDVAANERGVRSTDRLMKVYANANEKSKFHHFVGTYTITGVVKGNFKQIICNVPGIGKFTGYLLSR